MYYLYTHTQSRVQNKKNYPGQRGEFNNNNKEVESLRLYSNSKHLNNRISKYVRQILVKLKGEIDIFTITVVAFKNTLSRINNSSK